MLSPSLNVITDAMQCTAQQIGIGEMPCWGEQVVVVVV